MLLSAADQTDAIAALGEACSHSVTVAEVTTVTAFTGDFRLESQPVQLFDGSVMSSAPMVRITEAVKSALAIDLGSSITARSVAYTVAEARQEQSGLWLLILTKQ